MWQRSSRMISLAKSMRDDVEEAVQQVHQLLKMSLWCQNVCERGPTRPWLIKTDKKLLFHFPTTSTKVSALYLVFLAAFHEFLNVQLARIIRVNLCEHLVWKKTCSFFNDDNGDDDGDNDGGGGGGEYDFEKCLLFHKDLPLAWLPQRPAYYTQTARRAQMRSSREIRLD